MRQIKAISRIAFRVAIAFILSLSLFISSLPFSQPAAAILFDNKIPLSIAKTATSGFKYLGKAFAEGNSFLPDISLISGTFQGNLIPTLGQTFAPAFSNQLSLLSFNPTFAPTISLIDHLNFYFNGGELNFIKIVINSSSTTQSSALKYYEDGVKKLQKDDYRNAVTSFSEALKRDGNFAEAHTSRGRAYLALADDYATRNLNNSAERYRKDALDDFNLALQVQPKQAEDPYRYVEPLLARGLAYVKLQDYE
ncbi:MAG: tetratricopeptide repeat protein, partial [Spirulinaceae cyanobacterium]